MPTGRAMAAKFASKPDWPVERAMEGTLALRPVSDCRSSVEPPFLANLPLLLGISNTSLQAALRQAQSGCCRIGPPLPPVGISSGIPSTSIFRSLYCEQELDPSLLEFCLYIGIRAPPPYYRGPVCRLPQLLPQLRITSPRDATDYVRSTADMA